MQVLVWIIVAIGIALAIRNPLKRHPWVFYGAAIAVDALVLCGGQAFGLEGDVWSFFYNVNRRAVPAFALFTVVMFVGCFKSASRPKRWLLPVRAELSIMACILAVPHVVFYLDVYTRIMFGGIVKPTQITHEAWWVSVALTALLAVLGVLSFRIVRKHMPFKVWKAIQRTSYLFFALIWFHVVLVRLRPNPDALDSVLASSAVYGGIVVVYLACRAARFALDKHGERGQGT